MKNNKLLLMLLALACAVMVWLYDVTVVNPNDSDTFNSIPVTFENEDAMRDQGLMMTEGEDVTVSLRISGRRSELKKLSRTNIMVSVDLSQIKEAGRHELGYMVRYPANVSPGDLSIDTRTPAAVGVTVDHYIRRAVEIRSEFKGASESGVEGETLAIDADAMQISPAEVAVTGPADLVDSIDCAYLVIDRTGITETTVADYDYVLLDKDGSEISRDELVTDCETLSVSIPVQKFKEVPLVLKTQPGGGAEDENISYEMSARSVMISGEPSAVDRISQIELGTLKYAEVTGPITRNYPIILPEGVNNASGITAVDVKVDVTGLNVTTMNISEFEFINVPEDLIAEALSESIPLSLRGTPAALDSLKPEDVKVTVDLSGFTQAGTFIAPVSVEVPEGLQIGAIGSNAVMFKLS